MHVDGHTAGKPVRVALITGAGSGIGRAIALTFARKGILPVIADIDAGAAAKVVKEIKDTGITAESFAIDVAEVGAISRMIENIVRDFGSIDILVNNAGILNTTPISELCEDEWDRTMAVNLKSSVFATQAALKYMTVERWGRIINISSMAGRMGGYSTGCAYTASKAAMIGLTMSIARQVAALNITVNAVAPGTAKTGMVLGFSEDERKKLEQSLPMGRFVEPESIAETVAFLASDAAEFITGAVIDINGGMFMG